MSRIIVKNIPAKLTEYDLEQHFNTKGDVTDVKIMKTKNGKSRNFAFIGFKEENQAKDTIKYFNNSYLQTNKIQVEEAKTQGDSALVKPYSKHTKWAKETLNSKLDTKGKKKTEEEIEKKSNETKSKIERLKEIEKVTSAKFKFDVAQGLEKSEEKKEKTEEEVKEEEDNKENMNNTKGKRGEKGEINETENKKDDLADYDPKRLYLRNLSFQTTEEDIENYFNKFGAISEVSLPRDRHKNSFGYGFVSYETVESAYLALEKLDKKVFQGRILHITPAKTKDVKPTMTLKDLENQKNFSKEINNQKSSFKKEKILKLKSEYDKEVNWNYLFINQNAIIDAVSKQTGIDKAEILSKDNAKLAVEVASMETILINKTKEWLESQGLNLETFNNRRLSCLRSKTLVLIKNIDSTCQEEDLKKLFLRYGELVQFALSPNNIMGLAEFIDAKNAENCFKNLSFYEFNGLPLYLEYAPIGLKPELKRKEKTQNLSLKEEEEVKTNEKVEDENFVESMTSGNIVFVNNLSFDTKEDKLKEAFSQFNPVNVKIIKNKQKNNPNLSAGYGFIEFKTSEQADSVLRKLQGLILDNHSLKLSKAKTKSAENERKEKEKSELLKHKREQISELAEINLEDFDQARDDKLLIKNLAFEATKDEIRDLFKTYGDVKNVRLPLKTSGEHRGYAFVEFLTHEEAKKAFSKLTNTHFYGRKLVIEWAKKDKTVEDIRADTQKKLKIMKVQTHRTKGKGSIDI